MPPKPHPRTRAKQPANYTPVAFQGPETKQQVKTPGFKVSDNQPLPKNAGIRVLMSLHKKAGYTVYQNVDTRLGSDRYVYSEAWSMNTNKKQYDYFQVPPERRNERHKVVAEMWLEKGGVDRNYKAGTLYEDPWGTAKGYKERRTPPQPMG